MFNPEFKVGLLVTIVFVLIGYMSMKVVKGVGLLTPTNEHKIIVSDASGIIPHTAVKMAGVKIGEVKDISLEDGKAVITLTVDKGIKLSEDSYAEFKTDGILGTRHISIEMGSSDVESKGPLKSGTTMPTVSQGDDLGAVLKQVGEVAASLKDVAEAIKEATVRGEQETPIGRIVSNLERLTSDLAEVSSNNKQEFNSIVSKMDGILTTLNSVLGEGARGRVNQAFDSAYNGLEKFDAAVENLQEVTDKINNGEGTVGRLINDEDTVNGVNEVLDNLNTILGRVGTLKAKFDYHSEYLMDDEEVRSFIGVKLQPGPDRYYEIGIVQDPFGFDTTKTIVSEGTQNENFTETITDEDRIRITALFAKNFYNFTLKGGLIESTGGFGIDYYAADRKLRLSAEFFNFNEASFRTFMRYDVYSGIYLLGGYNRLFAEGNRVNSPFLGAGLFLTNEDLASLASFAF
jgi:phospholipid/cholesterol/gamma-HCH transport system substrate-binding protein